MIPIATLTIVYWLGHPTEAAVQMGGVVHIVVTMQIVMESALRTGSEMALFARTARKETTVVESLPKTAPQAIIVTVLMTNATMEATETLAEPTQIATVVFATSHLDQSAALAVKEQSALTKVIVHPATTASEEHAPCRFLISTATEIHVACMATATAASVALDLDRSAAQVVKALRAHSMATVHLATTVSRTT
jgi:hypothetical protein